MAAHLNCTTLLHWRNTTVLLSPAPRAYHVYLLHFHSKLHHAGHYLGQTGCIDERLQLHRTGRGAKLLKAITAAGITFEVARLWKCETWGEARELERRLKRRHSGNDLCPLCLHRPVDVLTYMRQGHSPLLSRPTGKRQPMSNHQPPRFVRRCQS